MPSLGFVRRSIVLFTRLVARSSCCWRMLSSALPASSRRRFSELRACATKQSIVVLAQTALDAISGSLRPLRIGQTCPVGVILTASERPSVSANSTAFAGISITDRTSFVPSSLYPNRYVRAPAPFRPSSVRSTKGSIGGIPRPGICRIHSSGYDKHTRVIPSILGGVSATVDAVLPHETAADGSSES
ncbi:hypothetical protein V1293_001897 [Bradyrhizobium sp. AZCC 1693]